MRPVVGALWRRFIRYSDLMQASAFVLAGGKSSRMGTDKAFLAFAGTTLAEHALRRARAVAGEVWLVGPSDKLQRYGAVVEDQFPNRGPLGGIHAALEATRTELNLILAVDLPFVPERLLSYLLAEAGRCYAEVTVPRAAGGWQPLCAVYRRSFRERARQALIAGSNKIDSLFASSSLRAIEEPELRAAGFEAAVFENLNTPEDWNRAGGRLRA